jgi:penicillin-binding protein-related factor A (putative recombinase)
MGLMGLEQAVDVLIEALFSFIPIHIIGCMGRHHGSMVTDEGMRNESLIGKKKYHNGKLYEQIFYTTCLSKRMACTRIPDGCEVKGMGKLVRVKSPFDWVVSFEGQTALIDTKSLSSGNLTPSKINDNQVAELLKHQAQGVCAGYVVFFTHKNSCVFYRADRLAAILRREKVSGQDLGPLNGFNPKLIWGSSEAKPFCF